MHPPSASCKSLFRHHPQLRLAWQGSPRKHKDDLNSGCFALVQLYHIDDVGSLDNPHTFREFWNIQSALDRHGDLTVERAYRGPIFNRDGGTERDWDPQYRVPIFVSTLDGGYCYPDGEPLTLEDIYTGKFMFAIEAWGISIKKRTKAAKVAKAHVVKSEMSNMSHMFMDDLKDEIKSDPSASSPIIARKHAYDHNKLQQERAERNRRGLNKEFGVDDVF